MKQTLLSRLALGFFVYFILHILVFRHLVLWEVGFVFTYVGFLLLIPIETNLMVSMIYGFGIGLGVDLFYDSLGIHAAACVATMYMRPFIIRFYTPLGGYDEDIEIGAQTMGWRWMITYVFTTLCLHTLLLFMLDGNGFYYIHITIIKVLFSSVLSTAFILLLYKIFYKEK